MYQDRSCKTCEYAWKYYSKSAFYKEKENESREKASLFVTGELLFFLWKIIKIYAYVVVFMYVPKLVFSKITTVGTSGFSTEDCFVFLRWFLPAW